MISSYTPTIPVIEDATRREFFGGVLGAALLIACGDDDEKDSRSAGRGFPVTIEHKFGNTTIPSQPKRVVAIGGHEQDPLLTLGVQPVALARWFGDYPYAVWPWAQSKLIVAPEVQRRTSEPDIEWVISLQPDLIIFHNSLLTKDVYRRLSQVAPTLAPPAAFSEAPWKETLRRIGNATGLKEQADAANKEVDDQIARVRTQRSEFRSVRIAYLAVSLEDNEIELRGPLEPRVQTLTDLGFEIPTQIRAVAGADQPELLSFEQLQVLEAADLLVATFFTGDEAARFLDLPVFKALKFARTGKYVFIKEPVLLGAITWSSNLSIPYMLDELAPLLSEGIKGNRVVF